MNLELQPHTEPHGQCFKYPVPSPPRSRCIGLVCRFGHQISGLVIGCPRAAAGETSALDQSANRSSQYGIRAKE